MPRKPDARRVVAAYLAGLSSVAGLQHLKPGHLATRRSKSAGEVRHVKDNSGDSSQWAYANPGMSEREMDPKFDFNPEMAEDLALVLRSTAAAMGHAISAQNKFAQIKSRNVSPDGRLGGRGYIQRVADMRRQYFNVVEALSALQDTLYDEVHAPHWAAVSRDDEDTQDVLEQTDEIRQNPGGWADEELDEE
jgi:hypothetical protein